MTHGLDINKKEAQIVRIPFMDETDIRPGQEGLYTKDRFFLNGYFEPIKNQLTSETELHFTKRPGLSRNTQVTEGVATGRRIYRWSVTNQNYIVTLGKIYGNSGLNDLGVSLSNASIKIGIAETRIGATTQYLGILAGTALYLIASNNSVIVMNNAAITSSSVANPTVITANAHGLLTGNKIIIRNHVGSTPSINDTIFTITKIDNNSFTIPVNVTIGGFGGTIGSIPTSRTGDLVYMDGYWFMSDDKQSIWNCALDDPTTWPATNVINAQMRTSRLIGLAQQSNYLIALGTTAFQLFTDVANPVGSPLANVEQGMQQIGCLDNQSIAFTENSIYWVSLTAAGGIDIFQLIGTTSLKSIGTPAIKRSLQQAGSIGGLLLNGFILRHSGHVYYVLNITSTNINQTWLYDQDLNIWYNWTDTAGTGRWPIVDITLPSLGSSLSLALHRTDGFSYTIDENVFQDNNVNFPVVVQTNPLTFGTMARKFYDRAELVGDKQSSTANALLSFTDDDFNTFSATRTLDMSQNRMFTRNLGNSRRRAWKVSYTGNTPFRLQALEFTIELDAS